MLQVTQAPQAPLAHPDPPEPQGTADQDPPDLVVHQVKQDMEALALEERKGNQEALCPTLEHSLLGHQDLLGLQDLKDLRVPLDQEDTKVTLASRVCQEDQEVQESQTGRLRTAPFKDHLEPPEPLGHQDVLDRRDAKGILEFLVLLGSQARREAPPQPSLGLRVLPVLPVLLASQVFQGPRPSPPMTCSNTSTTISAGTMVPVSPAHRAPLGPLEHQDPPTLLKTSPLASSTTFSVQDEGADSEESQAPPGLLGLPTLPLSLTSSNC